MNLEYNEEQSQAFASKRQARKSIIDCLVKAIENHNAKTILDFGCGTGNYIAEICSRVNNIRLIGVDPSESMLKFAREKNSDSAILKGDHRCIPLENNTVDMIFVLNVIHHVNDIEKMFTEFYRILKQAGSIYIHRIS